MRGRGRGTASWQVAAPLPSPLLPLHPLHLTPTSVTWRMLTAPSATSPWRPEGPPLTRSTRARRAGTACTRNVLTCGQLRSGAAGSSPRASTAEHPGTLQRAARTPVPASRAAGTTSTCLRSRVPGPVSRTCTGSPTPPMQQRGGATGCSGLWSWLGRTALQPACSACLTRRTGSCRGIRRSLLEAVDAGCTQASMFSCMYRMHIYKYAYI
mmetsp:Transcript_7907/g.16965  ORF Transcript_7907/g.16965 Transcript_7907/m.16965 type:complete len:211 (-) Transcript_7907:551-1183(-)